MDETDPAVAGTRIAVQFLQLWLEKDRLSPADIEGVLEGPKRPNVNQVIAGQLNLNVLLLFTLAEEHGANVNDTNDMRETARGILQDLSANLSN